MREVTGHNVTTFKDLQEVMASSRSLTQLLRASYSHLAVTYVCLPHKAPFSVEDHRSLAIYSDWTPVRIPFPGISRVHSHFHTNMI